MNIKKVKEHIRFHYLLIEIQLYTLILLELNIFLKNKHSQKPTDIFNKQDVTAYLTYIKILKDINILSFRLHILEAIFKGL